MTQLSETDRDTNHRSLRTFVRRHSLVSFFVLAYGISWVAWTPFVLSQQGIGLLPFKFPELILGSAAFTGVAAGAYLGPLGAAFLVTALAEGRAGLRRWRGRLFRWRFRLYWYVFAVLGVPVVLIVGTLPLSGAMTGFHLPSAALLASYLPFLLFQMVTTALSEEPGWRDFALPRIQRRHGPLLGSVILGVLWGCWHLPLFFTVWSGQEPDVVTITLGTLGIVPLSIVISWVFNRTQESLPVAMLIHASTNNFFSVLWVEMFPSVEDPAMSIPLSGAIGFGVLALVVIVATRGRLGYLPSSDGGRGSEV